MTQASFADNAAEKINLRSSLSSLYPHLLYMALNLQGKKPYLANDAKEQAKKAKEAGEALRQLQRGLTGDRRFAGAAYFSKPEYLSAYLLYYWPVSFLQTSLAIEELRARGALRGLGTVLDLGAGPGPAAAAAANFGAERLLLLDKSRDALGQAARLLRTFASMRPAKDEKGSTFLSDIADLENLKTLPVGPFDLIIACHSANELWKEDDQALAKRARLFGQAAERLSDGGVLLVIEPSALVTSRPALALRDRLLRDSAGGLFCAAPCPDSIPCPLLSAGEGRSCHSTWAWKPYEPVAALAAAAGLDRDSVKATWFALKKGTGTARAKDAPKAAALPGVAIREGSLSGRVVSEPMLNKAGRLRYIICTASGLATLSARKETGSGEAGPFFHLRRGDMIEASRLELREGEGNFGFVEDSGLKTIFQAPDA